jgi:hypothetical protein
MSVRQVLSAVILSLALSLTGGAGMVVSNALAEETADNRSIRQALEQQLGKRKTETRVRPDVKASGGSWQRRGDRQ